MRRHPILLMVFVAALMQNIPAMAAGSAGPGNRSIGWQIVTIGLLILLFYGRKALGYLTRMSRGTAPAQLKQDRSAARTSLQSGD